MLVQHDYRKNDTGQTPGSEPAHEQFFIGPHFQAGERQEDRHHTDQGEAEHCVEQNLPAEGPDRPADHGGAEHYPGDQGQCIARPFGSEQKFVLVLLTDNPTEQQAAHEAGDEAAAADPLRHCEAGHGQGLGRAVAARFR